MKLCMYIYIYHGIANTRLGNMPKHKKIGGAKISPFGNPPYLSKTCMSVCVNMRGDLETLCKFNDKYLYPLIYNYIIIE